MKNLLMLILVFSISSINIAYAEANTPDTNSFKISQWFDSLTNNRSNSKIYRAKERRRQVDEVNSTIQSNRSYSKSIKQAIENERDVENIESDIVPAVDQSNNKE